MWNKRLKKDEFDGGGCDVVGHILPVLVLVLVHFGMDSEIDKVFFVFLFFKVMVVLVFLTRFWSPKPRIGYVPGPGLVPFVMVKQVRVTVLSNPSELTSERRDWDLDFNVNRVDLVF